MPEDLAPWDAVIVGGGLAGAAAAIWLAKAGKSVLLVEKTPAAHHKVCGEFISIEAQHYLADLGVPLTDLGAAVVKTMRLVAGNRVATAALPFQGLSLSRYRLDEALLDRAQQSGATIQRGVAVLSVKKVQAGWQVALADSSAVKCQTLFMATGKHDLRGWQRHGKINDLIGMKMHYRLTAAQTAAVQGHTEIFLFDGGYAGLELIENGLANLCLVVRKGSFAAVQKDWQRLLEKLSASTPLLADQLKGAEACWEKPLAIYGIPYGYVAKNDDDPSFYRLGDQLAVIPSIFGDGMAIALHTAHAACCDYLGYAPYQKVQQQLRKQIWLATALAKLISISWLQPCIVTLCRWFPRLVAALASRTRVKVESL